MVPSEASLGSPAQKVREGPSAAGRSPYMGGHFMIGPGLSAEGL